jgi:hypothetical protein
VSGTANGNNKNNKPGRPQKDVAIIVNELQEQFNVAGEASLFFNDNADTQMKVVVRKHMVTATSWLSSCKPEEREHFELMKKRLQGIESCMKLWATWSSNQKTCMSKAIAEFGKGWHLMMLWMEAPPATNLESKFMWEMYLRVRVANWSQGFLADELRLCKMVERFKSEDRAQHFARQQKHVEELMVAILSVTSSTAVEVAQSLKARMVEFLIHAHTLEFDKGLLNDIAEFLSIVQPPSRTSQKEETDRLSMVLDSAKSKSPSGLLPVFLRFKKHSTQIQEQAEAAVKSQIEGHELLDQAKSGLATISKHLEHVDNDFASLVVGDVVRTGAWWYGLSVENTEFVRERGCGENLQEHLSLIVDKMSRRSCHLWADRFGHWSGQDAAVVAAAVQEPAFASELGFVKGAKELLDLAPSDQNALKVKLLQPLLSDVDKWYSSAGLIVHLVTKGNDQVSDDDAVKLLSLGQIDGVEQYAASAGESEKIDFHKVAEFHQTAVNSVLSSKIDILTTPAREEIQVVFAACREGLSESSGPKASGGDKTRPTKTSLRETSTGGGVVCSTIRVFKCAFSVGNRKAAGLNPPTPLPVDVSRNGVFQGRVLSPPNMVEALKDVLKPFETLEQNVVSPLAGLLIDLAKRFVQLAQAGFKLAHPIALSTDSIDIIADLEMQRQALEKCAAGIAKDAWPESFFVKDGDAELISKWASSMIACSVALAEKSLKNVKVKLDDAVPAKTLIEDPLLLSDVRLQKQLFESPTRGNVSPLFTEMGKALVMMREAQSKGIPFADSVAGVIKDCVASRKFAKTVIGIDFCIEQIVMYQPKEASEIPEWAKNLIVQLRGKAIEVPDYMCQLLRKLRKQKANDAQPPEHEQQQQQEQALAPASDAAPELAKKRRRK